MSGRAYLHGLDLLRVIASLLVVYTHAASWFTTRGHDWWLSSFLDTNVIAPLHLNQHLSFLGVATFLVVSGLVVTHVADRETVGLYTWRRFMRLFPLLVGVSVIGWILINAGVYVSESGQDGMNLLDLLSGSTLIGFFSTPEVIILGPAWTLLVQLFFYAFVGACLPLLRRQAWIPIALAGALVCLGLSLTTGVDDNAAARLGIIAAYFPVLCLGALVALVRNGKINGYLGTALGIGHFLLFVWADKLGGHIHTGNEHPRTLAIVFAVVVLAMTASDRISAAHVTAQWSARTYAIYLLHPLCLYPVLDNLVPVLGKDAALLVALAVLAVVTEIVHRWYETPINRWSRRTEKRRRAAATATARPKQATEAHRLPTR